jgi:uncharacterized membrane protein
MRFILNFILFGILFYVIYLVFPDAFFTMVGWANKIYAFLKNFFLMLSDKIQGSKASQAPPPHQAVFLLPLWILATLGRVCK